MFATATEVSLDGFLAVSEPSPYQPELREYLGALLHQQCTKPDWCVVGFNDETPVARAAFWAVPNEAVPTDVVLIAADWSDPDLFEAQALLAHMHKLAGTLGAGALQHHIDGPPGPPQYQENESARVQLMTEAGYNLLRDGLRWLRTRSAAHDTHPEPSLSFRNLAEVGEDAFVVALAATYEGTVDSMLTRHIQEHGLLGAAQSDFRDYQEMEYLPDWWELAYTEDDVLAGVYACTKPELGRHRLCRCRPGAAWSRSRPTARPPRHRSAPRRRCRANSW